MKPFRLLFVLPMVLILLVSLSACVAGSRRAGASRAPITLVELEPLGAASAHDAVLQLRPRWLRSRGASGLRRPGGDLPVVFVDQFRWGTVESLRTLRVADIASIHFLGPREATTYHGTGHANGIIQVTTKRDQE